MEIRSISKSQIYVVYTKVLNYINLQHLPTTMSKSTEKYDLLFILYYSVES